LKLFELHMQYAAAEIIAGSINEERQLMSPSSPYVVEPLSLIPEKDYYTDFISNVSLGVLYAAPKKCSPCKGRATKTRCQLLTNRTAFAATTSPGVAKIPLIDYHGPNRGH
jgi:hypothetical protein